MVQGDFGGDKQLGNQVVVESDADGKQAFRVFYFRLFCTKSKSMRQKLIGPSKTVTETGSGSATRRSLPLTMCSPGGLLDVECMHSVFFEPSMRSAAEGIKKISAFNLARC
jgi:hypothetical protein